MKKQSKFVIAIAAIAGLFSMAGATVIATTTTAVAATSGETVIVRGTWTKKFADSRGDWSIVERNGKQFVVLSDDFKTRRAPDLKIFLTPTDIGSLNGDNATDRSVLIAPLANNKGGQEYEVPNGVDINDYTSIVIHCEAYSKLWSAAPLEPSPFQ
ncbi:MAG: DM13 domain-containing protein [Pseudomonadota bacterium]